MDHAKNKDFIENPKIMKALIYPAFFLFVLYLAAYYFGIKKAVNFPVFSDATLRVGDKVFQVAVADTNEEKARGLGGVEKIKDNEGMLFIFDLPGKYGFWMKDMKFPIDIIWIRENKIVWFSENVRLPKEGENLEVYYPPEEADKVLEINMGLVQKYGFKRGDEVSFSDY